MILYIYTYITLYNYIISIIIDMCMIHIVSLYNVMSVFFVCIHTFPGAPISRVKYPQENPFIFGHL